MQMPCRAPGCLFTAHGYSTYCQNHKQNLRRHGSPTQEGVTVYELRPYSALIDARRAKNPGSEAWSILLARWDAVQNHAKATLQRFAEGRAGNRADRLAAHHLVTVGQSVEPWAVIRTALALFVMREQHPARFTSDAAFDFQVVRRVRGLTEVNAGTYWDHMTLRTKRVYRDIPPRVIQAMAHPLKIAFGAAGLMLAAKEREDVAKANDERRRLAAALESLE